MEAKAKTDRELLHKFLQGDSHALEALYHRHSGALYNYAIALCGNVDLARDLLQEFFLALCRKAKLFSAAKDVRAYMFQSMRHLALNARSRQEKNVEDLNRSLAGRFACPNKTPDALFADRQWREGFEEALMKLPAEERECVVLHLIDGFSFQEMQELCGEHKQTLYSRYQRALEFLRSKLASFETNGG